MTKQEFLKNYYCTFDAHNIGNGDLIIISKAIKRADGTIVDKVKTAIDIQETNNWIFDSQSPASIFQWSWDKVIDETKRGHLDYFAQRAPIESYFPHNKDENPDISDMYI